MRSRVVTSEVLAVKVVAVMAAVFVVVDDQFGRNER
jgi:hypothetical protein